jgi:hypothetical protein
MQKPPNDGSVFMKYTYIVDINKMEEVYLENAKKDFFESSEERSKFNAKLIIYADSEEQALKMRIGMTDIRMWELLEVEEVSNDY